ncbi:hypothetical protein [Lacibacter sediminis]|uniref:Outer membrane beta-barrel protein n=1 Tax=Lacibacter sediminis TaxID=2760713 RepID=A0A7G5XD88_9BACT|nr:hypothetical protein [Lacibacter sediminis]QNA43441.1 hypothetical protein H4075_15300 [Lacibacter sediminis]
MKWTSVILVAFISTSVSAQEVKELPRTNRFADFTATIGASQQTLAASYVYNWRVGTKRKFELGLGIRNTAYFGVKKDFWTAPADVARGSSVPFIVVVSEQKTENWDTLTVQRPFTNSLNLSANFGYHISGKFYAGFNIDLIGFTIGRTSSAVFTSNGTTRTEPEAKPVPFNLLLTGDLDLGSLNSEFFLYYHLNKSWSVKGVYQFMFVEYKTTNVKQTVPKDVDRFRNKANNGGIGVAYHF